mmetsp:Transcript_40468/g.64996  ORF Transcript_40468/g.64996 Transcript_40468/m.64996 type:complete len:143 (+) Transcript_40468:565-993(+)
MGEKIQPRAIEAAASAAAISLRDMNRLLNSNATQTSRGRGSSLSHGNGTPKHFGRIIRTKRALSKVRSKLALMKRIAGSLFICAGIILAISFGILVALCQGKAGSSQVCPSNPTSLQKQNVFFNLLQIDARSVNIFTKKNHN